MFGISSHFKFTADVDVPVTTGQIRSGSVSTMQTDLFKSTDELPAGMRYEPALISPDEEQDLVGRL
jgi:hypothetical protein